MYLHHPSSINGELLHINAKDSIRASYFELSTRIIVDLCETYDIYTVVHWDYSTPENLEANRQGQENPFTESEYHSLLERTLAFDRVIGQGRILWENSTVGIGAYRNDFQWAEMVAHTDLNLILDISHAFISLKGNNDDLERLMHLLKDNVKYFHVVDSMGKTHDSLPIGQGGIDFARIKPFITPHNYIYEVGLSDIHDCTEMVESHHHFSQL